MSKALRRYCTTLVYGLAALLLWLALGAAEQPRTVARVERVGEREPGVAPHVVRPLEPVGRS